MVDFEVQHPLPFLLTEGVKVTGIILVAYTLAVVVTALAPNTGAVGPVVDQVVPSALRQAGLVTAILYAFARVMQA